MPRPNVAFMQTLGAVLMTPRQFGPTIVSPRSTAIFRSSSSRSTPAPPTSLKPAEITTKCRVPASAASITVSAINCGGIASTTRSTGSSIAEMLRTQRLPRMLLAFGFTGYTTPVYPPATRFVIMALPTEPGVREAPTTATDCGQKSGSRSTALTGGNSCATAVRVIAHSLLCKIRQRTAAAPHQAGSAAMRRVRESIHRIFTRSGVHNDGGNYRATCPHVVSRV